MFCFVFVLFPAFSLCCCSFCWWCYYYYCYCYYCFVSLLLDNVGYIKYTAHNYFIVCAYNYIVCVYMCMFFSLFLNSKETDESAMIIIINIAVVAFFILRLETIKKIIFIYKKLTLKIEKGELKWFSSSFSSLFEYSFVNVNEVP